MPPHTNMNSHESNQRMERIIIIGGGIAGLSAAIALRRNFPLAQMIIIEAYPNGHKGAGMLLMDNGARAMRNLEADGLLRNSKPITQALVRSSDGRVVVDQAFDEIFCCSRKDIIEGLDESLVCLDGSSAEKVLRMTKKCTKVEVVENYVTNIIFMDETNLEVSPRDLVVSSDGVNSILCSTLNPKMHERPISPVNEIITATHAPDLVTKLANTFHKTACVADGLAFGLLPSTPTQVIGFLQFDTTRYDVPTTEEQKKGLFDLVVSKIDDPAQRELFEEYVRISNFKWGHIWKPINSNLPEQLHANNAVLIGDAAHPLLPFTSQNVSMALDDAIILAHMLKDPGHPSLQAALDDFVEKRRHAAEEFIEGGQEILDGFMNATPIAPYLSKEDDAFRATVIMGKKDRTSMISFGLSGIPQGSRLSTRLSSVRAPHSDPESKPANGPINGISAFSVDEINFSKISKEAFGADRWASLPPGVIPLTTAESDFDIAPPIQNAIDAYNANGDHMDDGPAAKGLPELREAIAQKSSVSSEQVFITGSAASSMCLVMKHLLTEPGDEVIVADPIDSLFQRAVREAGGVVRRYKLTPPGPSWSDLVGSNVHWSFDIAEVEALITDKTKVIGLSNPHGPVGRVWNRDELQLLAGLARKYDLKILSDEVWADVSFVDFESTLALGGETAARTYTVSGLSKGYGLGKYPLGYIIAPARGDVDAISRTKESAEDATAHDASALSQVAGLAALNDVELWQDEFRNHVEANCERAVKSLNAMPFVGAAMPQGTYVVLANVSHYLARTEMDEAELVEYLKSNAGVALVPGSPELFGPGAAGHVRLSVATSQGVLDEALLGIKKGLELILSIFGEN